MDKNNVVFGIIFICLGIFAAIIPYIGVLSPEEGWDSRISPVTFVIGIVFLVMGAMSKSETATIPQPVQPQPMQPQPVHPQPPQQIVRTLVICPKCGIRVSADAKFCPECGANLMPGKPQPT